MRNMQLPILNILSIFALGRIGQNRLQPNQSNDPFLRDELVTDKRSTVPIFHLNYTTTEEMAPGWILGNIRHELSGLFPQDETQYPTSFSLFNSPSNFTHLLRIQDTTTGDIVVTSRLDRDVICSTFFCLLKFDFAIERGRFFSILKILLRIEDVNDHPPTFVNQTHTFEISEGDIVGCTYSLPTATDADSNIYSVTRYIMEAEEEVRSKFNITFKRNSQDAIHVWLVLRCPLDREIRDEYNFILIAIDGGSPPRSGEAEIKIKVKDVNDNKPKFDAAIYEVKILENSPPGTKVIQVSATDVDAGNNSKITYSFKKQFAPNHPNVFTIEKDTGVVLVEDPPDYEIQSMYQLTVCAVDGGRVPMTGEVSLIVRLVDANDNVPQIFVTTFKTSDETIVYEASLNGTFIGQVRVIDRDTSNNGKTTCQLQDYPQLPFILEEDENAGGEYIISLNTDRTKLNCSINSNYELHITCRDFGYPPLQSSHLLRVKVLEANPSNALASSSKFVFQIAENCRIGTTVASLADVGLDNKSGRMFSIQPEGVLTMDTVGLTLKTCVQFDRETTDSYLLNIRPKKLRPTDNTGDHVIGVDEAGNTADRVIGVDEAGKYDDDGAVPIQLIILDVDDNEPSFGEVEYSFEIGENSDVGSEVGRVGGVDLDLPPFDAFRFVTNFSEDFPFRLDSSTGQITTTKLLNCKLNTRYETYLQIIPALPAQTVHRILTTNQNGFISIPTKCDATIGRSRNATKTRNLAKVSIAVTGNEESGIEFGDGQGQGLVRVKYEAGVDEVIYRVNIKEECWKRNKSAKFRILSDGVNFKINDIGEIRLKKKFDRRYLEKITMLHIEAFFNASDPTISSFLNLSILVASSIFPPLKLSHPNTSINYFINVALISVGSLMFVILIIIVTAFFEIKSKRNKNKRQEAMKGQEDGALLSANDLHLMIPLKSHSTEKKNLNNISDKKINENIPTTIYPSSLIKKPSNVNEEIVNKNEKPMKKYMSKSWKMSSSKQNTGVSFGNGSSTDHANKFPNTKSSTDHATKFPNTKSSTDHATKFLNTKSNHDIASQQRSREYLAQQQQQQQRRSSNSSSSLASPQSIADRKLSDFCANLRSRSNNLYFPSSTNPRSPAIQRPSSNSDQTKPSSNHCPRFGPCDTICNKIPPHGPRPAKLEQPNCNGDNKFRASTTITSCV